MKKLWLFFSLALFSFVLAWCSLWGTPTTEEDTPSIVEQDHTDEQDTAVVADVDYCDQYVKLMQCFVDNYPEEYDDPEADLDALVAQIYTDEIDDQTRQSMCAFSLQMMQAAALEDEDFPADDLCGVLDLNIEGDDSIFQGLRDLIMEDDDMDDEFVIEEHDTDDFPADELDEEEVDEVDVDVLENDEE